MATNKLNKKVIKQEAQELINQGNSKQKTFELLNEKYGYGIEIANVLKKLPSLDAIKRYKTWNYVLLGILILSAAFLTFTSPEIKILFWYGGLIYIVAKMLVKNYIWVSIFSGFSLITIVGIMLLDQRASQNLFFLLPLLTFLIPTLILPIWLTKKLCPNPVERKEEYTNLQGQQRLRIVYEFAD